MPTRDRWRALCVAALVLGCAGRHVPSARRASVEEAVTSGRGTYSYFQLGGDRHVTGELIAVDADRFWVLTRDERLISLPVASVERAWFGVFKTFEGALTAWTVVGALTTLSHGVFLVLTFPGWLAFGVPVIEIETYRGLLAYPPAKLAVVRMYARFPQGLPPGLSIDQLLGRMPDPNPTPEPYDDPGR